MHQCGKFVSRNQEYRACSFGAQPTFNINAWSTLTSNENIQISISHEADF